MKIKKAVLVQRIQDRIRNEEAGVEEENRKSREARERYDQKWRDSHGMQLVSHFEGLINRITAGEKLTEDDVLGPKERVENNRYGSTFTFVNRHQYAPPEVKIKEPHVYEAKRLLDFLDMVEDDVVSTSVLEKAGFQLGKI